VLRSVEPKVAAVALGAAIAVTAVLGTIQAAQGPVEAEGAAPPGGFLGLFYLDGEYNVPALLTAGIWLLAAAAIYAAGRARERGGWQIVWTLLSVALLYLSADEALKLHERVEGRADVDWQVLYLPLLVGTALAGLLVVIRVGPGTPRNLLVAAGVAAVGAQVLEALQWNGDQPIDGYRALMVPEELLEATSAALVAIAALMLLREAPPQP
jgi:hypothetical protein